ncbi:acetyl esterase/lipase [Actinoplanes octamycinicus]|uniref:Acetyl esterase/lipase n=1 Tax=Actinoplanes octamycinicus TaxID=135948 RepID=A0A7W7MAN9_9ACTN|nr:alpha/beta hydrolase [Actinoplanes octamycinicus]MBB4743192.1 acetyl esterase/lipase [Actinoplanes octamycinicus]GIE61245.1 alpha/beta hydrolase [Actinoplanes octamycinicus]
MNRQQQRDAIRAALAASGKEQGTTEQERAGFEQFVTSMPLAEGVVADDGTLGGRPAVRLRAPDQSRTVLLYLHGGGYVIGSARTGARLASALVARTGATGYSLDYRLAPEHPFPGAVEDALAAYRELLESTPAGDILVAGDSAGGGLVVALLVAAREAGLPQPAAAAVFSPWADLTLSGDSIRTRAAADPLFDEAALRWYVERYAPSADAARAASPIFADLSGLAPLLVQVGADEVLLDDAVRLAARAAAHDVEVTLEAGPGLPHVYQLNYGLLDDADDALDRAGAFLARRLPATVAV